MIQNRKQQKTEERPPTGNRHVYERKNQQSKGQPVMHKKYIKVFLHFWVCRKFLILFSFDIHLQNPVRLEKPKLKTSPKNNTQPYHADNYGNMKDLYIDRNRLV